jgi:hypothetical protein
MKKKILFISTALILLFVLMPTIDITSAQLPPPLPTGPLTPPTITIQSPTSTTYHSWFVPLEFTVNGHWDGYVSHCSVYLSIDEQSDYVLYSPPFRVNGIAQNFSINLGPLSEGYHNLKITSTVGGAYRLSSNSSIIESGDFSTEALVGFRIDTFGQAQILVLSPQNQTYNFNKDIPVEFVLNRTMGIKTMGYTLDQEYNVTIPRNTTLYGPLPDGRHKLEIFSIFSDILPVSSIVEFSVDTTPPKVTVLSLTKEMYNSSSVPLVFSVNETVSLITYILDGKVYTTSGNTTMTVVQNGIHEVKVYATDQAGNAGSSEIIDFQVQVVVPPDIAIRVLPPLLIVLVGGFVILIVYKKRRLKNILNQK